jgi:hypothetical protein
MDEQSQPDQAGFKAISRRRFLTEATGTAVSLALMVPQTLAAAAQNEKSNSSPATDTTTLSVDATPSHAVAAFDPDKSLGSSMDILSREEIEKIYTPEIVRVCLSAGWGPITYRLNTEQTIEAWHWNHNGAWSDPAKQRGYFVGNAEPQEILRHSFGYSLPNRGCTHNGGSEGGYSRLTDGDPTTFWKSNPYLTQAFTGEDDAQHPQWIIVDFGAEQDVNAIRIHWCEPSAQVYEVQYWTGEDPMNWEEPAMNSNDEGGLYLPVSKQAAGRWTQFAKGIVRDGRGGQKTLKLADDTIKTRFVRVVMTQSSNQPGPHGADDVRHRVGYAIYEVFVGRLQNNEFIDFVNHAPNGKKQTATYCSSTDPWHSVSDLNPSGDQTGLDLFLTSGITNNLPAMIPVAVTFSVPEDAAAQMAYLKKRGYPIAWVEMGEESDGQYYMPEDYGALYLQFATAIHKVDPTLKLGGPVFQGINQDISVWPDAQGRTSWFGRFLDYLKSHGRLQDLAFVSFELYPFDTCSTKWEDLFRGPELTRTCLQAFRDDGLPKNIPLMNTESNLSGSLSRYMSEIFAALWVADSVGSFFLEGGAAYYHSPIQPGPLENGCQGWATWGSSFWDSDFKIRGYTAFYFASQLINLEWVKHGSGEHQMFRVTGTVEDAAHHRLITTYAIRRPDGNWSLLLVNKDQNNAHKVRIEFEDQESGRKGHFVGPVPLATFGSEQYVWHSAGKQSHANPSDPPLRISVAGGKEIAYTLPKASVTVLRGRVEYIQV